MTIKNKLSIEEGIYRQVEALNRSHIFLEWAKKDLATIEEDDLILFNNSLLFRDQVQTNKNPSYLCFVNGKEDEFSIKSLGLANGIQVNADFKHYSKRSKNLPQRMSLSSAIEDELASLGRMVFVLIGQVDATECFSETINHSLFNEIRIDPSLDKPIRLSQPVIYIRDLLGEEIVFSEIASVVNPLPEYFYKPFHDAYLKLVKSCYSSLQIPKASEEVPDGFLDIIANSLYEHAAAYKSSLEQCGPGLDQSQDAFNNVLRIAYDFEGDAVRVLRLLMSVCDLKPIIFWMTLSAQHNLSEAFRCLPRSRDQNKPSLNNYKDMIRGGRNKAFHNLFPFNRSIEVDMDGIDVKAKRLRFFSEYKLRTDNVFDFEDKQLIEILKEFTRAEEKYVPPDFWQRNYVVMVATARFVSSISEAIKILNTYQK